ncbi:MAG: hypothetical protein GWP08_15215 [Nitrospiraceae bacterium]|nr:hypothetical protein [Nitrospiraceae bacterium]
MNVSLNGEWRLACDPDDVGIQQGWFDKEPPDDAMAVRVPSVWDRWIPDYDGVGWYFREFELDGDCAGRHVELQFDAVDYYGEVWLNGTRLGGHEGGYTPFVLNATEAVVSGVNRLAVRVVDPHGPEGYGDFVDDEIPSAKEGGYFSFAGIWGDVQLTVKPLAHIRDVFVVPDIRRKRVAVTVETSEAGTVHLSIDDTPFEVTGEPGRLLLPFPEYKPWSPDHPTLYTLRCRLLQDGEPVHETAVRFGMREFTVKDNRFYLNNHPIFLKGVLHQPDYPASLVAPETPEMARRELELAKEAGFNLVRLHIKTAPKITLELADEIGLLLYEEPPIGWIKKSKWMKERCEREVREMILRDRNHPSVVIWGMLNESGNAHYVTNGGAQTIKDDLCRLARSLDPSRIVIDDSGGVNGTREPARFMRPYRDTFEVYDDLHIYQRAPVDRDIELYYRHSGDPNLLYFLSEFGFGGMEDLADVIAQYGEEASTLKDARFLQGMLDAAKQGYDEHGLDRVFGSFSQFAAATRELQCEAARHQIDACRTNGKLAGYCYTQLCDAGHEFCAGVLDRWRRPKPVFDTFKQIQQSLRPIIQTPKTNLVPREEIPVTVSLINDDRIEGRVDLSLQVIGPTNQVLWKKKRSIRLPKSGKELWSGTISASGSTGLHRFAVRLMRSGQRISENQISFHVFEPVEPCEVEVNVLDPAKEWSKPCHALAKPGIIYAPIHIVPPLGNSVRVYPDNDLAQVLAQVNGGAVAIVFGPPDDWNDLAERIDESIRATSKDAVGAFLGMYHYVKLHPVFDGLPARGLMGHPYRNTAPAKTFTETSDEDICGTFDTTPIAAGNYMIDETTWWGSDVLVCRYGSGRIVFTHLRVLQNLGHDPVADRIFVNLLRHFSRRSVPPERIMPLDQKAVEWMRHQRKEHVRRWMVIGPFPNWGGEGHATAYPPEETIQFDATYPGWYAAIGWKPWHTRAEDDHLLDFQQAFTPIYEYYPRFDNGVGYAYAEITSDRRQDAEIHLELRNATKVWVNGVLVHESKNQIPHDKFESDTAQCTLRQGRNAVLVKASKIPGPFGFGFVIRSATKDPLQITWWK